MSSIKHVGVDRILRINVSMFCRILLLSRLVSVTPVVGPGFMGQGHMAAGLLDEMVQNCFLPLQHALDRAGSIPPTPETIRELLAASGVVTAALEEMHRNLAAEMAAGIEGRKLFARLNEHAERLRTCLSLHRQVRDAIENASLSTRFQKSCADSNGELMKRTEKITATAADWLRWLELPAPKLDPKTFRGTEPLPDAGGFERLEDVIARFDSSSR
jgi:hypothetical protein